MNAPPLGQPIERKDGVAKVTGTAAYASDHQLEHMVYGSFARSTIAAGRITAIDARGTMSMPGVIAVLTHETMPKLHSPGSMLTGGEYAEKFFPLQDDQVHYWASTSPSCSRGPSNRPTKPRGS